MIPLRFRMTEPDFVCLSVLLLLVVVLLGEVVGREGGPAEVEGGEMSEGPVREELPIWREGGREGGRGREGYCNLV